MSSARRIQGHRSKPQLPWRLTPLVLDQGVRLDPEGLDLMDPDLKGLDLKDLGLVSQDLVSQDLVDLAPVVTRGGHLVVAHMNQ